MNHETFTSDRPTVSFTKRWHRLAIVIFVVCWATMLFPQLLIPDSAVAKILTLALLGIGASAVLLLLLESLFNPSFRRGEGRNNFLELNQAGLSELTDGAE
jgi:hypothetical protein